MILRYHNLTRMCLRITALLICTVTCASAQMAGTLTLVDGKVALVRGATVYAIAEGAKVQAGDILHTDAKGQAQIEVQGGLRFNLGPTTQLLLLNLPGGRGDTDLVVLTGWVKFALKKSDTGALRFHTPTTQILAEDGTGVLHAGSNVVEIYVETGAVKLTEMGKQGAAGSVRSIKGGNFTGRTGEQPAVTAERPPPRFVGAMPRHFQDNLHVLVDRFKNKTVEPKREHEATYAEVEAWLKAGLPVRRTFVNRFQARARDTDFRKGLVENLRAHPEWDPVLFPEKYRKPDNRPTNDAQEEGDRK